MFFDFLPKNINTILLLIQGEGGSKWFCAEKGSTEYKSIQKGAPKCTTKLNIFGIPNVHLDYPGLIS